MTTVYEEIAREAKCLSLSSFLFEKGFGSDWVAQADYDWWKSAAAMAGVNPPNPKDPEPTITRTIELLKERESGAFDAALDSTEPPEDGTVGPDPTPPSASAVPSEPSEAPGPPAGDVAAAPSASKGTGAPRPAAAPSATASEDAHHRPPTTPPGPVVQASIFDPPYQRHSETSRLAAEAAKKTQGPSHQRIIALLRERGPLIDQQMQELLGMNESTQRPRRRELAIAGVIEVVGRGVTRAGNPAVKWALREEAQVAS